MHAFVTGATKKQNVSRPGPQNASQIEPKSTQKSVSGCLAPERRTLRKHLFLLSQTHIWHPLGSTISLESLLWNAAKNTFEKRLTKERSETLEGSTLGRRALRMCPKRLPIGLPSRYIFRVFFYFCL